MKPVYRNLIILCLFLSIVACVWHFGNLKTYVNVAALKDNQQFLNTQIPQHPVLSAILYIVIFFVSTLSALPVTLAMITLGGFLFGTLNGSLYALIAIVASSLTTFSLSKRMFGKYIQEKYSHELKKFNDNFEKYGFYYLVAVRTIPVIPFFIVNLAAGFTQVDTKTFIFSTLLGALPTVLVCCHVGSQCAALIVNC